MTERELDFLFNPASVALVGASAAPGKIGSKIVDNLIDNGYTGRVYPVNARVDSIGSLRAYPDVASIPEPVDVAYVLVPADAAVEATWDLGKAGCRAVILAAAGFAETNTALGREREASLVRARQETGIRIVGPNCNGIYNVTDSVSIGFNTAHSQSHRAGGLGVLSHSGALFSTVMARARTMGVGISTFVSVGNECDLDILDFMEHLVFDEATRCLSLIVDSIPDGQRFAALTSASHERGKSVVVLKLGTSEAGASAAVAHSSRMAGRAESYAAFFRHCGVGTVDTIEQLIAVASLIDTARPLSRSPRLGVAVLSGGAGTVVADAAARHEVDLPPLGEQTQQWLDDHAPGAPVVNPIDLGAAVGVLTLPVTLELLARDPAFDAVLHYYHPMHTDDERRDRARQFIANRDASDKPHIVLAPAGLTYDEQMMFRDADLPAITDTDVCMAAIAAAGKAAPRRARVAGASRGVVDVVLPARSGVLDDASSIRLLSAAGVPMVDIAEAGSPQEAVSYADRFGYPVVLKGMLDGVAHKSDSGLVSLGIVDGKQCADQARRLLEAGCAAVLVQPMLSGTLEALIGLVDEPRLGRFLMFGTGGVFTEAIRDVAMVPVGADDDAIAEALATTTLGKILQSPRWVSSGTFKGMVQAIQAVGDLALADQGRISAIDVNPLLVKGDGIVGVDGLIVLGQE